MATSNEAVSETKLKKKSVAKQQWQKLRGKVNEVEPPKAPPKDTHHQPHKEAIQHKANSHSQQILPVVKPETSKDDQDITELQQEYQREYQNIQRNMSSDMKHEGGGTLPVAAYDSHLEGLVSSQPVVEFAPVPDSTQFATIDHGSIVQMPGPTIHSTPPMQQVTHAFIVAEPDPIEVNRPERRPRRPSGSQAPQGRSYDHAVSSDLQQRQVIHRKAHNVKTIEGLVSDLEKAQLEKQDLKRELENKARLAHERSLAMESMEISHNELSTHLDIARQDVEKSGVTILNLQNEISALQADALSWQRQFDLVNNELLQLRMDLDKHVSDKWFQSQWKDLNAKIETLSIQYFVGRQSKFSGSILGRSKGARLDKMEIHPSISLTRLTNEHARYLGSDHDRPLIIQAFVWWVLVNRIFAHTACDEWGFFWAGQSRELLYHLKRQILPHRPRDWHPPDTAVSQRFETDARNYHNWRATTAMLLQARTSVDKRVKTIRDLIKDILDDVCKAVSPYVVSKGTSVEAAEEGFRKQLETIFGDAIKIDAEMAQQRSWLFCEQWRAIMEGDPLWGFTCHSDEADVVQTTDQTKGRGVQPQDNCVELIIQPALFRSGNQYGEGYVKQQVLCKAKVVLGETVLPPFQHR